MRRPAVILGCVLFASYAYFFQAGGWNQNSRFDLTRAIVERGTIQIDAYHENTLDKAASGGHYYSDKAPGASFVAVPAVWAARLVIRLTGHSTESPGAVAWMAWAATLASAALPAALTCVGLFAMARRFGASETAAAIAALALGLGSPFWAYGTLFFGHALAAACLIAAWMAADRLRGANPHQDARLAFAAGLTAGFAVITEFPCAIAAALIAAMALAHAWSGGWPRRWRVVIGVAAGAGVAAAVLLAYQWAAFGSPFHLSYASEENAELLSQGFFGITMPKPAIVGELLWGSYRGLLPLAPVLVFAFVGLGLLWKRRELRVTLVAGVLAWVLMLLLNSAYEHWEGGWTIGTRHLVPTLGFVAIGVVALWDQPGARRVQRLAIAAALLMGVAAALVAVSTTPQPPADYRRPMRELLIPAFETGNLSLSTQSYLDLRPEGGWAAIGHSDYPHAAWNLGEKMGLHGLASLLPLLGIWVLGAAFWVLGSRRPAPKA